MAIILHINTAFETASVFLSNGQHIIASEENHVQKEHASFLDPAIKRICDHAEKNLKDIDAIAVVNGPGSYTGLRVGLASAKALCYALNKPLILLNTLDVMAWALKLQSTYKEDALFCPVIDARRNEIFTALYDNNVNIIKTHSAALVGDFFLQNYRTKTVFIGGNGSLKLQGLLNSENFIYINPLKLTPSIVFLCTEAYDKQTFSDIVYSEPFYLKPVYFKK